MLIDNHTLTEIFDTNTLQRGKRYFAQSRVQDLTLNIEGMSIQVLRAKVIGSQHQAYRTEVRFDRYTPYRVDTYCSCPVGFQCKHAAAVILQANYEQSQVDAQKAEGHRNRATGHTAETWLARLPRPPAPSAWCTSSLRTPA